MNRRILPAILCAIAVLCSIPAARAADADVTGLVPTIWWDFESQPDAAGLTTANKGSASISFTSEGTKTYQQSTVTNGWALDTSKFTPYSTANGTFSTAGGAYTVSLVMNLGSTKNGITLNLRNEAGERDLIIRRGATTGSLVVGCDLWKIATRNNLETSFEDDSTYHLVSVIVEESGMSLYVDGEFVNSTNATPWSASGRASRLQFGSHLSGVQSGEAKYGGCIDDLRIYNTALTPAQMNAIAVEFGLATAGDYVEIVRSGKTTLGKNSFQTPFALLMAEGIAAEASIVYGTDAVLSAPTTNVIGSALLAGTHTASLSGLASGTTYWWKIVASNGVEWAETEVESFRTLDEIVPANYARRIPAVISGYTGLSTLTNFPVLVKLAAGAPAGFDYVDCAEGGADIRFAAADGAVLAHEIDTWNTNGESFVWVKVPTLAGATTAFSMYYGASDLSALPAVDPRSVWIATDHRAVWHFAADTTESAQGLIPSLTDGTPSYDNTGAVGKCWQSAGTAWLQYDNDASWSALGDGDTLTISAWAKFDSSSYDCSRIFSTMSNWEKSAGYELTIQKSKNEITIGSSGRSQYQKIVSPGPMDEMVYLTAVYNADCYADLYVNGVRQEHKKLNPVVQPTEAMAVARAVNGNYIWDGNLDELRLHATAESADWVKACYDTMATPASFAVLSPVESTDVAVPRLGALAASDENGTVTFSVELALPGYGGEVPTAVSVFYGTDGENWTELPLGATNEVATLSGAVSGFAGNTRVLWYVAASATKGGLTKRATSLSRSFVTRSLEPAGNYKFFTATVAWNGEPVENIPVLLRISETAALGFSYADVTESRFEIVDAAGHLVPYEIDVWNPSGESIVWALLPDYRNGATLTVRYGTAFSNTPLPASEVWAAYKGVWHMNSTSPADVSNSGNDGTAVGSPAVAAGEIGPAISLPSSSDYVTCGSALANSELASGFTVEGWANPAATSGKRPMLGKNNFISVRIEDGKIVVTTPNIQNHTAIAAPISVGTWFHWAMTFVPGSGGLKFYANGALVNTQDASGLSDATGSTQIWLGRNQWDEAYTGLLDEMRIRAGICPAVWLAAEYHAMGDASALVCSAVASSDTTAPVLGTPSVLRNLDGSFTVSVDVSENAPETIVCTIGGTDYAMTTSDSSLPATYSTTISGLADGTYTATAQATSASGTTVSATCPTAFYAGALVVEVVSNADEGTLTPGVFRISRADADPTGLPALPLGVAFSGDGLDAVVAPTVTALTIPAGAAYVDISVTPVPSTEVAGDKHLTLTVSGTYIGQASSAEMTVVNADYDVAVRYVATEADGGDDANHGGTPELPKKTIGAAVSSLANVAQTLPCTVHVAPGLYPISSQIVITNAISILGDDPDPSHVVVSNLHQAGWAQTYRVFNVNHADALVANLTMQKGSVGGDWTEGANFCIESAGGTVSNCVVEAGEQRTNHASGGGATLGAGLVTHTVFRKNTAPNSSPYSPGGGNRAAVLHLYGSSRAENCLLADNPQSSAVVLVRMGDSALMRNCTIVDSRLASTSDVCKAFSAIRIDGSAVVVNTVIAGVTNTIDGAACPPTGSVANFQNGAFDGDATGLPEGTITGTAEDFFEDYANGDYTPKTGGLLVNEGADYDGMAAVDLAGKKRKVGKFVDIGCFECQKTKGFLLFVR